MEIEENVPATTAADASRVLVVDDNATIRSLVAHWLRSDGYTVLEARDGLEALNAFRLEPVQVVITDVGMPGVGGLELLAALRRLGSPPEVILLTGSHASDTHAAVQALRLGAHDYIVKDEAAAGALSLAVRGAAEKWRLREENARLLQMLRRLSVTDALTGVGNRRAFDQALSEDLAHQRRHGGALSLVLLDLDHFKRVNDTLGHRGGDEILVGFAGRLHRIARESDRVFRFGGEEFALLLRGTPLAGAAALAQRVVDVAAARPLAAGRRQMKVTCSAGVAAVDAPDATVDSLTGAADAALYEAKRNGRNRVFVTARDGGSQAYVFDLPCHADARSAAPHGEAWGGTC